VVAFEPNPKLCELVAEHVRAQSLSQIEIRNCALGSEEGSVTLTIPGGVVGSSFVSEITNRSSGNDDEQVTVPMRVGAEELREIDGDQLVLKLDVEGAELEVLNGLEPVLRDQIVAAQIEVSPEWLGADKMREMQKLLTRCGFEIFSACKHGVPKPISVEAIREQQDIWCVKPSMRVAWIR
jgi:FkbM family methyltransferase